MPAVIGQPAPNFELRDQQNNVVSLSDLRGQRVLLVFIPFPFTGTCQNELCAIRDDFSDLEGMGARIVAITCDTRHANRRWTEDQGFQFPILSDFWPHGATCQAYGCFNEATGGALRWSFLIDENGVVREIIKSQTPAEAREHAAYARALAAV
jgi:peroxiredoxin (alkyl hydroperoxide reductase subunit C)